MYFEVTFSNGYCGCDETIYIEAKDEKEVEEYAANYMSELYPAYEDASQCLNDIEDYENEEDYWEDFACYQAECDFMITEISEEEIHGDIITL